MSQGKTTGQEDRRHLIMSRRVNGEFPQGLKPASFVALDGTTEVLHPSRRNPRRLGAPVVPFPEPFMRWLLSSGPSQHIGLRG